MITRLEIIYGMINMNKHQFKNKMFKYIYVTDIVIEDIISRGTSGEFEKYVAYVLDLKKHIPKGFVPIERVIIPPPHKKVNEDQIQETVIRGEDHGNYSNGKQAALSAKWAITHKHKKHKLLIKKIISLLGGAKKAAQIADVTLNHVYKWKEEKTCGHIFIMARPAKLILDYAIKHKLPISKDDLYDMLPVHRQLLW